jgi:hypothetical protein
MQPIPFEDLPITTMTLVIELNGLINVDAIFCLLPVTKLDLPPPKRRTQKFKIPFCGIPGAILSMRYRGNTRGIVRSSSSKFFKNCITTDICTTEKNISIKLSTTGFHICGASSVEQGREGATYIINYILEIQKLIDDIANNPELAQQTLEWAKKEFMGKKVIILLPEQGARWRHHINRDVEFSTAPHPELGKLFVRQMGDYMYYEDLIPELEWILTLQSVATPDLSLREVRKVMVNYNYGLGFPVNRMALARQIDGVNGFHARYNNAIEHSVTVELPYQPKNSDGIDKKNRRKNKNPHHTFLIYRSGLVTQSGPDDQMMKEPYERFIQTIQQLRPQIESDPQGDV